MSDLLNHLHFKDLHFKGEIYDQPSVQAGIDHLARHLKKNFRSCSPFVLFTAQNHIKTVIAWYAILKAGKIGVILDPQLKQLEYDETIHDICPAAVINIDDKKLKFDYKTEVIFRAQDKHQKIESDLKDVCMLSYTNAEDGYAKAAMLTEKNLLSEATAIKRTNYLDDDSVLCALLPYSHLYGFAHGVLAPTLTGGSGLITEVNLLKIAETVEEIQKTGVTHLHTVPSIYYILSKMPNAVDSYQNIKKFFSGGIQLPSFIYENFYRKTGKKIHEGYGLTEGSPAVAGNYDEDGPLFGSFGKAFPGCEIKIMKEDDHECPAEEIGEICVRGDMVFKGYFNYKETTDAVLRNQWLYTGDFGKKDAKGNIYFCGLKKNMINIAGNKLYPQKLIRLFRMHQNVVSADIRCETSLLQGNTTSTTIRLRNNAREKQDEFKLWCFQNINNTLLPKTWIFD